MRLMHFFGLVVLLVCPDLARAVEMTTTGPSASGTYSVALQGERPCSDCELKKQFVFTVKDLGSGAEFTLELKNRTERVRASLVKNALFIVEGELPHGGDIITLFDLATRKERDSFWGYNATLSESKRYVAFVEHYPRSLPAGALARNIVNVYDMDASPSENRSNGNSDPRACGFPVFPEERLVSKDHRSFTEEKREENVITSDFFWFEGDRKLVFFEWKDQANYLIVVDLSHGPARPSVRRRMVGPELSADLRDPVREKMAVSNIDADGSLKVHTYKKGIGVKSSNYIEVPLTVLSGD